MVVTKMRAKNIVEKEKRVKVINVLDYDDEHYITVTNEKRFDPYYSVDKKTGEIMYFSPTGDLERFLDALDRS